MNTPLLLAAVAAASIHPSITPEPTTELKNHELASGVFDASHWTRKDIEGLLHGQCGLPIVLPGQRSESKLASGVFDASHWTHEDIGGLLRGQCGLAIVLPKKPKSK